MNKIPLLLLKKINFITLLKSKANNDISLMNYLIYIGLTINFEEFKAANPI
jgi:hypothetical protein